MDNIKYSGRIVVLLKTVLDILKKSNEEYEPRWDELISRHEGDTSEQSLAKILGSLNCMYILAIVQSREKLAKEAKSKFFDLIQKDEYQNYTATFYSDSDSPVTYAQMRKNLEKEDKHGIRWAYFDEDGPLCAFFPDNFATAQKLHKKYGRKRVMSDW